MAKKLSLPFFLFLVVLLSATTIVHSVNAYENSDVKVGTYVYTWYDTSDPVSWEYPKITDMPYIGYYNSCDADTILTQMTQISSIGIDFVCLNWLGVGTFSDLVVGEWFRLAKENCTNLKLSIMVEPYNETTDGYNYTAIYERAFELFSQYESVALMQEGKPVLFLYNGEYLTGETGSTYPTYPSDSRLQLMTIGHRSYVDVWYDDIRKYIPETIPHGIAISVLPRFDDYWQYYLGMRDHTDTVDRDYTEGLYAEQWQRALDLTKTNSIKWVFIATWNEYPERTEIEPHYDNTAKSTDPFLLFNQTETFIDRLHGQSSIDIDPSAPWYQNPYLFGIIILGIALGVALIWK